MIVYRILSLNLFRVIVVKWFVYWVCKLKNCTFEISFGYFLFFFIKV